MLAHFKFKSSEIVYRFEEEYNNSDYIFMFNLFSSLEKQLGKQNVSLDIISEDKLEELKQG